MNKDTIIRLAREAGLWEIFEHYSGEFADGNPEVCLEELERFAELVAAHEREECAKAVQVMALANPGRMYMTADQCATVIRSRKC